MSATRSKPAPLGRTPIADIDIAQDAFDAQPVRIQAAGQRYWAGDMKAINTTLPLTTVVKLAVDQAIWRQDFALDSNQPGNRLVDRGHVERIKRGLGKHAHHLMLGAAILAVHPDAIAVEGPWPDAEAGKLVDTRVFGLKAGSDMFIIDFQHRKDALVGLWNDTIAALADGILEAKDVDRLLRKSSVPVIIALEPDPEMITHMFVALASTKPISQALIVAMDHFDLANKLGLAVARKWKLLGNEKPASRMEFLSPSPKKDTIYTAAAVRAAAANVLIGFKDRSRELRDENLEKALIATYGQVDGKTVGRAAAWIAQMFDYAASKLAGWRDLTAANSEEYQNKLAKFKESSLLKSAGGLYVVAGVIAAARAAGLDVKQVIDAMADPGVDIPWTREDVRHFKDLETHEPAVAHRFFEGLLTKTALELNPETGTRVTVYRSAGGNRSQYEPATRKVLEHLAKEDRFKDLIARETLISIGLEAERGRGRPRKAA